MPGLFLIAAAAASAASGLPDIQLTARVRAREVRIEQQGRASVRVRAEPSGGDKVDVTRNLPKGQQTYRNLELSLDASARIADRAEASERTASQTSPTGD